jgi:murein DD-endopeptidase MepM/ murein hydrolase activator NlpD
LQPPIRAAHDRKGRPARALTYLRAALLVALALLALAEPLHAATGPTGGAGVFPIPRIADVRCAATAARQCAGVRAVQPGGTILIRGSNLSGVHSVLFQGRAGSADDLAAPIRTRGALTLAARVPAKAVSGAIVLLTNTGVRSRRWHGLVVANAPRIRQVIVRRGPVSISTDKFFYGASQAAELTYQMTGGVATDVVVSLLRAADGAVVRTWQQAQIAPGAAAKVAWDGTAAGRVQREGQYVFRVAPAAAGSTAGGAAALGEVPFSFYDHMFPIQGPHDYGGAGARFGAGRSGHSHQGQDVFAACGTPLVASRAGKVIFKGYHAAAGYYVVVRGQGSGLDYAYMHLRGPALVKTNDVVYTGQPLGEVGETGNAQGCHLHFELWSAPGWYAGGQPLDPLAQLKRWDRGS